MLIKLIVGPLTVAADIVKLSNNRRIPMYPIYPTLNLADEAQGVRTSNYPGPVTEPRWCCIFQYLETVHETVHEMAPLASQEHQIKMRKHRFCMPLHCMLALRDLSTPLKNDQIAPTPLSFSHGGGSNWYMLDNFPAPLLSRLDPCFPY